MQINFDFIKQNEGKAISKGYIPKNEDGSVMGQSGVTIASGFDLGQQDATSISGLPKELQNKLIPYLGAKKNKAVSKLKETGGLQLTDKEVSQIDMMAKEQYSNRVKQSYNKLTGKNFDELPSNLQTVIADVQFQYGTNYERTPKFSGIIQEIANNPSDINAYMKLESELRNFGDDYKKRRGKEADLIQEQINKMQVDVELPEGAALTGGRSGDNIHTNFGTGIVKKGSAEHQALLKKQQNKNVEMYMKAKKTASLKVATKFNILNVMNDLGQTFQKFDEEEN